MLVDRHGHLAHRCARAWSWLILKTTGVTVDIEGLDDLPRDQPYLFLSNHQSIYDIPVLFWHLPYQVRILAKPALGKLRLNAWHLRRRGHVNEDRSNPGNSTMTQIKRLMQEKASILVFPEGTRSADGSVARFRGGVVMLAIEAGLPIVPVSVEGTRHVMLKGRLMTCPGHVRVRVLPPIPTAGCAPGKARELAGVVERQVRAGVEAFQVAPS